MARLLQKFSSLFRASPSSEQRPAPAVASPPVRPPSHTLRNTQLRALPRSANGREYLVYVAFPYSYNQDPSRRYPVLYACDAYWHFTLLNGLYAGLVQDRLVPEYLTIGIGYAGENPDYDRLRQSDLSPVRVSLLGPAGKAADFLHVLQTELIPYVDQTFRTDPRNRVLAGSSLGGLFTLYSLFSQPQLFSGGIAISPSVALGNDWIFGFEENFARATKTFECRLYMACGGSEFPSFVASIQRFSQQLARRQYAGFAREFRVIEGERHSSAMPEALSRGLRFVFEPLAPESGPQRE